MNFTQEKLQNYLMRHVKRVTKDMKRKAYGNKHRQLFSIDELEFKIKDYEEYSTTLAEYSPYDKEIYISSKCFNKNSLHRLDPGLLNAIGHELIHHYVYENFYDNYGFYKDSSPIFLSYLVWFGFEDNGHYCFRKFQKSNLYKKVKTITSFYELESTMIDLYFDYKQAISKIKIYDNRDTLDEMIVGSGFYFGSGRTIGLTKVNLTIYDDITKLEEKYIALNNIFEIGCNVMPNDLERLYIRKRLSLKAKNITRDIFGRHIDDKFIKELSKHNKNAEKIIDFKLKKENWRNGILNIIGEEFCLSTDIEYIRKSDIVEYFKFKEVQGDGEIWELKLYNSKYLSKIYVEEYKEEIHGYLYA